MVDRAELLDKDQQLEYQEGDMIELYIVALSDGQGGLTRSGSLFETEPEFTHSVAVGDFDQIAVGTAPAGVSDDPIASGNNGRSSVVGDINAFVHASPAPPITGGENPLGGPLVTNNRRLQAVGYEF